MSDVIPTPEEAARVHDVLGDYVRISFDQIPRQIRQPLTDAMLNTVLPLLEAIAAGRVFEVRPERCANCSGHGGFDLFDPLAGTDYWNDCPRCDGSGYEPAPPGRKQRTAYDAMIEAVTDGKHGDRMRKLISEQLATRPCTDCDGEPTFEFAKCYTCDGAGRLPRDA